MILIAIREGDAKDKTDKDVMFWTRGKFVHAEIVVMKGHIVSYGAWEGESPSFKARTPTEWMPQDQYKFFYVPLSEEKEKHAWAFLERMRNANLQYRLGWECAIPEMVVRCIENDIDVHQDPSTWGPIFCSQVVLLFLRKMFVHPLLHTHSSHCSPTLLHQICVNMRLPQVSSPF